MKITKKTIDHCAGLIDAQRQLEIINPQLTWAKLSALEPRLERLRTLVRNADPGGDCFCAQSFWYNDLKPELVKLVGFQRPEVYPILSTSTAYAAAYRTLLREVPRCRNCPIHN